MAILPRELEPNQRCQVWTHDLRNNVNTLIFETRDILLEAPNWSMQGDALILNGNGKLWRMPVVAPELQHIEFSGVPPLNNDHVLDPDGKHIFLSTYDDWQLYRAPLHGGAAVRVSGQDGPDGMLHFLHGVSPDGKQLAFVGVKAEESNGSLRFLSAEICTLASDGTCFRQITSGGKPADGPEYSPDGEWIYFNTESFSTNSQIARMRPDGSDVTQLTYSETVNWFPHMSADGRSAVFLAFPNGTRGHPANLWVKLMLVADGAWDKAVPIAELPGGQGTINVNSWAPDSRSFAYVAYPFDP